MYSPGVNIGPAQGITSFTWAYIKKKLRNLPVLSYKAFGYQILNAMGLHQERVNYSLRLNNLAHPQESEVLHRLTEIFSRSA